MAIVSIGATYYTADKQANIRDNVSTYKYRRGTMT